MPTFNFGFKDATDEIGESYEDWKGPIPPNGAYRGILKVLKIVDIKKKAAESATAPARKRLSVLVTVNDDSYPELRGYPAFGNLNLTEQGQKYINQFLRAISSDEEEFARVHKVFYGPGPRVDEKKENILKIGPIKIGSPEGELPIMVQLKQEEYQGTISAKIKSFLFGLIDGSTGAAQDSEVVEEQYVDDDEEATTAEADEEYDDDEDEGDNDNEDDGDNEIADESILD